MRTLKFALLASVALAVGASNAAFAQTPQTHVMTVRLPDGGVGRIEYTGNTPPRVVFDNARPAIGAVAPLPADFGPSLLLSNAFGADSPFAAMRRISAEMDRQAAAMFRQVDAMATRSQSGQPIEAAIGNLPAGGSSYSFVSTMSGNGVCSRSVEITSTGNGAAPKVVSHSSGNCGPAISGGVNAANQPNWVAPSIPATQPLVPTKRPDVLWTSADGPHPAIGIVRKVADNQR